MADNSRPRPHLNRGVSRDVVIILTAASILLSPPAEPAVLAVAITTVVLGCLLHVLTKGRLIRNTVLCADGPYSFVRHPYYLANFLIDGGICLFGNNLYLMLAFPFLFFWAYGPTISREEGRLRGLFGDRFLDYQDQVPQLFPSSSSSVSPRALLQGFSFARISRNEVKRLLRITGVVFLMISLYDIRSDGWSEFWPDLMFWRQPADYDGAILCGLTAAFFCLSAAIPRHNAAGDTVSEA